jgi:hypothetical protein
MRIILLTILAAALVLAQSPAPGSTGASSSLRGMPPCSSTVTTNCVVNAGASGSVTTGVRASTTITT